MGAVPPDIWAHALERKNRGPGRRKRVFVGPARMVLVYRPCAVGRVCQYRYQERLVEAVKFAAFNARCPYELGDKIRDTEGKEHTITDIVALHSMKEMKVRFVYELDNSGKLVALMPQEGAVGHDH